MLHEAVTSLRPTRSARSILSLQSLFTNSDLAMQRPWTIVSLLRQRLLDREEYYRHGIQLLKECLDAMIVKVSNVVHSASLFACISDDALQLLV